MTEASHQKQALRRAATARLATLSDAQMAEASAAIVAHLQAAPLVASVTALATYAAWRREPDLRAFTPWAVARGLRVYYPRYDETVARYTLGRVESLADLAPGRHGILEPALTAAAPEEPEWRRLLWLVPGLAFDRHGRRLGRGAGDYDRLLASAEGPRIGVAFSVQLGDPLPVEPHDVPMLAVFTPEGVRPAEC
jgi:5-formyltetrahydrofolate cyclo-ligase